MDQSRVHDELLKEEKKERDAERRKRKRDEGSSKTGVKHIVEVEGERIKKPRPRKQKNTKNIDDKVVPNTSDILAQVASASFPAKAIEQLQESCAPSESDAREGQSTWEARMERQDDEWKSVRSVFPTVVISRMSAEDNSVCSHCYDIDGPFVKCGCCKSILCHSCDKFMHRKIVTHDRQIVLPDGRVHNLLPYEFITSTGILETIRK